MSAFHATDRFRGRGGVRHRAGRLVALALVLTVAPSAMAASPAPPAPPTPPASSPVDAAASAAVASAASAASLASAATAPSAGTLATTADPVLVGAGDIGSCSSTGDTATAKLVAGISGTVFTTGDNVYSNGTTSEFANCYNPTWGALKSRTRPSAGNHDYNSSGARPYYAYFGSRAGAAGKGYYAYNVGTWRIYVLNSNCGAVSCSATSTQVRWLKADLAANPRKCVLAYWHHPLVSSGKHGNSSSVKPFWDALYAAHAEVVLNGHDHHYERFAPMTPSRTASAAGIREFVVGTGGVGHYAYGTIKPNSVVRNNTTYGVLKLTLHASSYDWKFVPQAGKTFTDSGSASCR